jgi:hypothetical protein
MYLGRCEGILSKPHLLQESMKSIEGSHMSVSEGDILGLSLGIYMIAYIYICM